MSEMEHSDAFNAAFAFTDGRQADAVDGNNAEGTFPSQLCVQLYQLKTDHHTTLRLDDGFRLRKQ